jgi:hypothetical protein
VAGLCSPPLSTCKPNGKSCLFNTDCCSSNCEGVQGNGQCLPGVHLYAQSASCTSADPTDPNCKPVFALSSPLAMTIFPTFAKWICGGGVGFTPNGQVSIEYRDVPIGGYSPAEVIVGAADSSGNVSFTDTASFTHTTFTDPKTALLDYTGCFSTDYASSPGTPTEVITDKGSGSSYQLFSADLPKCSWCVFGVAFSDPTTFFDDCIPPITKTTVGPMTDVSIGVRWDLNGGCPLPNLEITARISETHLGGFKICGEGKGFTPNGRVNVRYDNVPAFDGTFYSRNVSSNFIPLAHGDSSFSFLDFSFVQESRFGCTTAQEGALVTVTATDAQTLAQATSTFPARYFCIPGPSSPTFNGGCP